MAELRRFSLDQESFFFVFCFFFFTFFLSSLSHEWKKGRESAFFLFSDPCCASRRWPPLAAVAVLGGLG